MRKSGFIIILVFCLLISLSACGETAKKEESAPLNLQEIYESMLAAEETPAMVLVPPDKGELLFGIPADACVQNVTAICQDSLRADEIWLIEAKDEAAAGQIESLAKARIEQKASELKDYLPEQYAVVQKARVIRRGNTVALMISPAAEELAKLFQ